MTVVLAHLPGNSAEPAFAAAVRQAVFHQTDLVIVNVASGDAPVDPHIASTDELNRFVTRAAEADVAASVEQPIDDDVAGAIVQCAERHRAEVVVIGVRRRSAVGKLLLGSVAQRVMLESESPVLGIKPIRVA